MQDIAATVLAFLFAENKKEHPIPAKKAENIMQKIRNLIYRKEDKNDGKN